MASIKDRLTDLRERHPVLDHVLDMQEHYSEVKANQQAGGVTYYAFLSFFPILALAVFTVGLVSRVYPGANQDLVEAINSVLPGIVGPDEGQVSLSDIRTFSGWAAVIGLAGVLYSGLAWMSALREGLFVVFEKPSFREPNFILGKLRDLATLATLGLTLLLSVAATGFVRGFSDEVLELLRLDSTMGWLVELVTIAFGLAINTLLFFLIFRMLVNPEIPRRSLLKGALLGAVGFELLKVLSQYLLQSTKEQPAFQAFGIALVLVVWINYSSRVTLYAAAWGYTTHEAQAGRLSKDAPPVQGPQTPPLTELPAAANGAAVPAPDLEVRRTWLTPFAGGAAATLAAVALLRKRRAR